MNQDIVLQLAAAARHIAMWQHQHSSLTDSQIDTETEREREKETGQAVVAANDSNFNEFDMKRIELLFNCAWQTEIPTHNVRYHLVYYMAGSVTDR